LRCIALGYTAGMTLARQDRPKWKGPASPQGLSKVLA
jgi:hypothetical protein